jgi:hypothetical protein
MRIRHTKYMLNVLTFPFYVYIIAFAIGISIFLILCIRKKPEKWRSALYAIMAE